MYIPSRHDGNAASVFVARRTREMPMRQWIFAAATTLALSLTGAVAPASAMPINPAVNGESAVLPAQFAFGGRNYCFYPNGWNGPGFYWCGYAHRRGYGWGGRSGWRGWHHHGYHGRPHYRPGRPHMGPRPGFGPGPWPGGGRHGGGGGRHGGGGGHHGGGGGHHGGGGHRGHR